MGINFTFTLPAGHKPGKCAAEGNHRYALNNVVACKGKDGTGYLVATNGRALSVLPIDQAPVSPIYLPASAVSAGARECVIEANGEVRRTERGPRGAGKTTVAALPEQAGRFPAVDSVIPLIQEGARVIHFDARELANIVAAIAPDGMISLVIHEKANGPMSIVSRNSGGFGLLMPLDSKEATCQRTIRRVEEMRKAIPSNLTPIAPTAIAAPVEELSPVVEAICADIVSEYEQVVA